MGIRILIDGYNFLHGAGIVADAPGPYSLEKSRRALIGFLTRVLTEDERRQTVVVFDAKEAPPNLPRRQKIGGVQVLFADRREDADTTIRRLVEQHHAPKNLVVVSSDHQVQRAARRRRAEYIDSDDWFRQQIRRQKGVEEAADEKPATPLDPRELRDWLEKFGETLPPDSGPPDQRTPTELADADADWNPFPEGYGDDLLPPS